MADKHDEKKISFKDTLNLPRTDFPMRANAKTEDPKMVKRWEEEKLFEKSYYHNEGNEKYILHDGPPYANGNIHLGHALNKILKDVVGKSQRMFGKQVPITPGWDCHGLPIELKVTQEKPDLSQPELIKACRNYAQKWVDIQRDEFKELGILMNWDHPYLTMNYGYEASILRAFGIFVGKEYIERKNKTVPWCASCETVLASAEIEYKERKDPSIYVMFPLVQEISDSVFPELKGKNVNLVIWTTTPWTLPLNRAITLKPNAQYVILEAHNNLIIVGQALADKVCAALDIDKKIIKEFKAEELQNARAHHPFVDGLTVPILFEPSVVLEEGTACVHTAPGVGPEDYEIGVRHKLDIYSPISPDGKYTNGIQPKELEGMSVKDGQIWVIKKLNELGKLLHKTSLRHPYPHCWRCRNGLIFRATKQWFCDLERNNLKERVLEAIPSIKTIPEKSVNRLRATVEGRLEWCLSRQRVWGVPIPALICTTCDNAYTSQEFVDLIAEGVSKHGVEYWQTVELDTVTPKNISCSHCGNQTFTKEQDILDVWFDSGISHYAVLLDNPPQRFPANMYLEGSDQHRGWFQSSLLTSMVIEEEPAMKTIMTHGFTVDEQGRKMSKSIGNVMTPGQMTDKLGVDGLRLWVASIDVSGEAVVSDMVIKNVQQVFRKIRNTCRFLLSNLYDFDIDKDAVPLHEMLLIDQYALQELHEVNERILQAYDEYDFTAIYHALGDYSAVNLSSFYLDIIKDRLYVEKVNGKKRRSAQTACWYILDTLTHFMAPILSFTAERVSDCYQKNKTKSIHLQNFAHVPNVWESVGSPEDTSFVKIHEAQWDYLKELRDAVLKAIEQQREQGLIKHSLESKISLYVEPETPLHEVLIEFSKDLERSGQSLADFMNEFLIVSQVEEKTNQEDLAKTEFKGLWVKVNQAEGEKCPRCWNWDLTDHEHNLCRRCQKILELN